MDRKDIKPKPGKRKKFTPQCPVHKDWDMYQKKTFPGEAKIVWCCAVEGCDIEVVRSR